MEWFGSEITLVAVLAAVLGAVVGGVCTYVVTRRLDDRRWGRQQEAHERQQQREHADKRKAWEQQCLHDVLTWLREVEDHLRVGKGLAAENALRGDAIEQWNRDLAVLTSLDMVPTHAKQSIDRDLFMRAMLLDSRLVGLLTNVTVQKSVLGLSSNIDTISSEALSLRLACEAAYRRTDMEEMI
jgi:hypothetical protein